MSVEASYDNCAVVG